MSDDWPDLAGRVETIALALLGEPNRQLSTRRQWRYGTNGSLAIEVAGDKAGQWYDHERGAGGSLFALVKRETGAANGAAVEWLRSLGTEIGGGQQQAPEQRIVATYDYRDESGTLLYQAVRYAPKKKFKQRRPDGRGDWIWSTKGMRQVPYRLLQLKERPEGAVVYICEGEKDADRLAKLGLCATTNPGGANKWRPELNPYFAGADVAILPDADETGRAHATQVAHSLHDVAASVRVLELPNLPAKGDVSDWLDAGNTADQLQALAEQAPLWEFEATEKPGNPPLNAYSDEALTLGFSARHADELRYCELFSAWFRWQDGRWRQDVVRGVFSLARRFCRDKAGEVLAAATKSADRIAGQIASAKTIAAVVNLARADTSHATAPEDWDADPWVLNTPAGIVNLRTGQTRPHDRAALCSKMTAVAPTAADCPRWQRFLDQVTAGDRDLQAFLRRIAGYCLTGSTREHALFFLHGAGADGKGTFVNTLTAILGDYSTVASMDTFTDSRNDRHPTELAMLRGARMVAAQETEEGRGWAESRIKALTGGDPITARFMHKDFFTFEPAFKLLIAGNHRPGLRNIDEAIRRRFHLLPFTVIIPPDQRDPNLFDKLKAEWPAILGWALLGCLEWQADGLNPPAAVIEATAEYFDDEDSFGRWLEEACIRDPMAHPATACLYAAWKAWAERSGLSPGTEPKFREALAKQGFQRKRVPGRNVSGFLGIRLRDYPDEPQYGG